MDFESSGNYLKHVIIFGCLYEVNPAVLKSRLKSTWRLFSVAYLLKRPNPVLSLTPYSNYKVISSFFVYCEELGRKGSAEQNGREEGLLLSHSPFFFLHTIISPSFHFGSTNIAARGGEGWR